MSNAFRRAHCTYRAGTFRPSTRHRPSAFAGYCCGNLPEFWHLSPLRLSRCSSQRSLSHFPNENPLAFPAVMAPGDVSDSIPAAPPVTPQQDHKHQQQSQAPAASASVPAAAATHGNSPSASTITTNTLDDHGTGQKTVAEYLKAYPHLTDLDIHILSLPSDGHFTPHSWDNLHQLIGSNDLHLLTRSPSQTRAYLDWTTGVRQQFGSITNYLLQERLKWTSLGDPETQGFLFEFKNATPFADADDYLILQNDWPYGLDPGIMHICVWLKTPLDLKPEDGDLTDQARGLVEEFVKTTFREPLGEEKNGERVLWFKNWAKLQSVRGIDHVHVLVKDAPSELLKRWMK